MVYALIYTDLSIESIALQSQWYTRPSGFLTRSFDRSESSQVKQIKRSIFLSSSLLPSLVYEISRGGEGRRGEARGGERRRGERRAPPLYIEYGESLMTRNIYFFTFGRNLI